MFIGGLKIPIWIKGQSENTTFADGTYDFVFKKPDNFYLEEKYPNFTIPLWRKTITFKKVYTTGDHVHAIVNIKGNPIWVVIILLIAIAGVLGLGILLLVRIDRVITFPKMLFIMGSLFAVMVIIAMVKGKSVKGTITGGS